MNGLPSAPTSHTSSKLGSKERDASSADRKETGIESERVDYNEEDSYWRVEMEIPTENMISDNDRASIFDSDFDERSMRTFQLDDTRSWVDVHIVSSSQNNPGTEPIKPSLPQVEKLRIRNSKELDKIGPPSTPVYFLRLAQNSKGRLSLSRALYNGLIKKHSVTPCLNEFVLSFGFRQQEYDFAPPPCRYRTFHSISKDEGSSDNTYECVYGLRYVTPNQTENPNREKWSVRQFSVYHKFSSVSGTDLWVFIGAPQEIESRIDHYIRRCSLSAVENPFAMHFILIQTAISRWRWYLVDLTTRVQDQSDEISAADIAGETLDGFVQVKFQNRLKLRKLEDLILTTIVVLQATISTIKSLQDRFFRFKGGTKLIPLSDDALTSAFDEILEDSKLQLSKAELLYKRLQSVSALLSDLLPYQNASSLKTIAEDTHNDNTIMRQLTEQTTKDSGAIKTITIITVVFLPATVVASIFSTQFVQVDKDNFRFSAKFWIYFAVTIPLTLVVLASWLLFPLVIRWIRRGLVRDLFRRVLRPLYAHGSAAEKGTHSSLEGGGYLPDSGSPYIRNESTVSVFRAPETRAGIFY